MPKLRWKDLKKKGIPRLFWPGLMLAWLVGVGKIEGLDQYYKSKIIFPKTGVVEMVEDGDTLEMKSGVRVRLIGINAPERGKEGYEEATAYLNKTLDGQRIWLEYDRYQDDIYGRVLAWVWLDCEGTPKFEDPLYMRLSGNRSREGLTKNPKGCEEGKLINEELVKNNLAKTINYGKRGPLKYGERIEKL